jgi:hypothetical protein
LPTARAATVLGKFADFKGKGGRGEASNRARYLHFMENIGENQGTSRKIKRFFPEVSVLPSGLDALKRLGKTGGLERLARRGERGGSFAIRKKTKRRGTRRIGKTEKIEKDRPANERSFQERKQTARRRNREGNGVDGRFSVLKFD